MTTFILGAGLLLVVALVIRLMIKRRKQRKFSQCGNNCNRCGGGCH